MHLDEADSTSNRLIAFCADKDDNVDDFTTIQAEYQSAGKGQKGNHWEAEAGANLLFSFVLYPTFIPAGRQFIISKLVSLAVKETLDKYAEGFSIKWPNDIYWHDKKICGMLIEVFLQGSNMGRCICGIGINANQTRFISDAPNPVSLKQITGHDVNRQELLDSLLTLTEHYYSRLKSDISGTQAMLEKKYAGALYRREGLHAYKDKDGQFNAELVNVEPDGRFILRDEEGKQRSYLFKEVQYII